MATKKNSTKTEETFNVRGKDLIEKIKEILHEGNIRRIIIKNKEGRTILEIPVTAGVVGVLIAPQIAALGVIAALIADFSITVVREA